MLCACGLGAYKFAFYHLITHGFFKALLFFTCGIIIHNFQGEQDMRKMGNFIKYFPFSFSFFFAGTISLIGLPGTAGFYSKEKIIDYVSILPFENTKVCYGFLLLGLSFTVLYSCRLFYYIFLSKDERGSKHSYNILKSNRAIATYTEAPLYILIPLLLLSFLSYYSGDIFYHYIASYGSNFMDNAFPFKSTNEYLNLIEEVGSPNGTITVWAMLFGLIMFFYSEVLLLEQYFNPIEYFNNGRFNFIFY